MVSYLRFSGASLPGSVGVDGKYGTRLSDGRRGHLCYGPYFALGAGTYIAGFYIRLLEGSAVGQIDLDIAVSGEAGFANKTIYTDFLFAETPSLVALDFTLHERAQGVEARVFVHENVLIEIDELVVFSRRQRSWGGA